MSIYITLSELDGPSEPTEMSDEVATLLASSGLLAVAPAGNGNWQITPTGKVGCIQTGDVQVDVRPKDKVGLSRLLFLLGYARDPGFKPGDVDGVEDMELLPALAESLCRHVRRALGLGPIQGYVSLEDSLYTVRGRIRISDQLARRPGMLMPLEAVFDEYTVDIAENRILLAALRRMLGVPRLGDDVGGRLRHLIAKLDGVSALRPGSALPVWQSTRLNQRYHPALRFAEIVLRNCSAEAGEGDIRVASFMVNMATVFEDFVATALREAMAGFAGMSSAQYETYMDELEPDGPGNRVLMKADLVHAVDAVPAIVFDAKYKAATPWGQYPNADHYQMLAYCTALSVKRAWLVYAGPGEMETRHVRFTDKEISIFPLDLSRSPQELLERVGDLAAEAWRVFCKSERIAVEDVAH